MKIKKELLHKDIEFLCQSCYKYYRKGKKFCPKCGNVFKEPLKIKKEV